MRRVGFLLGIAVMSAGLIGVGSAPAGAATTGSIKGMVTDHDTGDALSGICVYAITDGGFILSPVTGANGKYTIPDVPAGSWEVFAEDCTHQVVSYVAQVYRNLDGFRETDRELVPVSAGSASKGINFSLRHGGDIEVTTVDKHGTPVPNIYLCAQFNDTPQAESQCMLTDDTGVALLRGELVGKAKVYANPNASWQGQYYKGSSSFATAKPVKVKLGQVTHITMKMVPVAAA
jgi:Carboxypeptidase regulatory-like domain